MHIQKQTITGERHKNPILQSAILLRTVKSHCQVLLTSEHN